MNEIGMDGRKNLQNPLSRVLLGLILFTDTRKNTNARVRK
jgi:hypothetical protein